jgi:hypothetical protein
VDIRPYSEVFVSETSDCEIDGGSYYRDVIGGETDDDSRSNDFNSLKLQRALAIFQK